MTVRLVAQHAGVSAATVSRVINSVPGIRAETVEAVKRSIAALTYTPAVRRRSSSRVTEAVEGRKVAFVVMDVSGSRPVPAYDYLLRGVSRAAMRHEIDLQVLFLSDVDAAERRLSRSNFDGLILHGVFDPTSPSDALHRLPTVWVMGNRRRPTWGDQVMPNNITVGQMAAGHLIDRGHRQVGYFGLSSGWSFGVRKLAFEYAIEDAGGTVLTIDHRPGDLDAVTHDDLEHGVAALMRAFLASPNRPTALFLAEDEFVRPVHRAMQSAGLAVGPGGDVELVSCNNDPSHLVGVWPVPATIDIRYELIGDRAVEQLVGRLTRSGPPDRMRVMIEPELVRIPKGPR
jgi:LacI family transcriptional regulator